MSVEVFVTCISTRKQTDETHGYRIIIHYNNNNNMYLLQLDCHPVAVVILHVNKT